ncbi:MULTISPECIES: hypothetical protein [unclassified Leeuwenhoekiella]|uniref:hypothetical protein n=1 Tax=unclassified Leeuwenhoekiella TaxID=2615029 RepID=UPI000C4D7582|nr:MULTISPECIES: hypothetical protein [unclassified Leeuwenhoekiella]MAW95043.1 hypothetical protein [Leeuwenhoekiella sp.]MBA79763.1 hypothetical protein [Leeuwenhoekiella sp.]|tara:strand:- start:5490 stop:6656 length:1167 start_codon:yes stop_codon:yes gene_type:complete
MAILKKHYSISQYEQDSWVLERENRHYIISAPAKELLDLLSNADNLEEACAEFNGEYGYHFTVEQFWEFIVNRLGFTGLLLNYEAVEEKEHKFINLQFVILNEKWAGLIAIPLIPLFNKVFFYVSFSLLFLLAVFSLVRFSFQNTGFSVIDLMLLYLGTILLHELGHIAACKRFTGKNGEIGGGLYLIFPVLFSNITALWQAKKSERIIGNLAGVYMQLWCLVFFYLLNWLYPDFVLFNQIVFVLALYSMIQLIPFIRSDGYWLLSDLSSTPNLLTRANAALSDFVKSPKRFYTTDRRPKASFLLGYSVFNNVVILYFVGLQLVLNSHAIIEFPLYLIEVCEHIIHFEAVAFDFSYFPVLLFYIVSFQLLKRGFDSIFKSTKNQEAIP